MNKNSWDLWVRLLCFGIYSELIGDRGEKGDDGEVGEKGSRGIDGRKGEIGQTAAPSERGETGFPGPDGEKGEPGPPGRIHMIFINKILALRNPDHHSIKLPIIYLM